MVKAEIDTTNIRIGEQFNLKISINETQNVILPKLEIKGLEVIDSTKIDTVNDFLVRKYILTGFDSGAFYIPQQQIFIKNQAFFTDSLLVNVATIAVDTLQVKKFPIKSIKSEPYSVDDFRIYAYLLLAAILIIGFWIYWFVIRKRKESEEEETYKILPPYEEAIYRLNELDEKLLWQNNKIKEYYSELTEIVRGYIERELNVSALENTTDEILEILKEFKGSETIQISKETFKKLRELLREADLVKFAKAEPAVNIHEQFMMKAIEFVRLTKKSDAKIQEEKEALEAEYQKLLETLKNSEKNSENSIIVNEVMIGTNSDLIHSGNYMQPINPLDENAQEDIDDFKQIFEDLRIDLTFIKFSGSSISMVKFKDLRIKFSWTNDFKTPVLSNCLSLTGSYDFLTYFSFLGGSGFGINDSWT